MLISSSRRQFPELDLSPRRLEWPTVRSLYGYSGYIMLNNVAMFLLFYSGEVLIGMFVGTAAVTPYAIARSLVQYLSTIIGSMTQVFHPYASDQHERGNAVRGQRRAGHRHQDVAAHRAPDRRRLSHRRARPLSTSGWVMATGRAPERCWRS